MVGMGGDISRPIKLREARERNGLALSKHKRKHKQAVNLCLHPKITYGLFGSLEREESRGEYWGGE